MIPRPVPGPISSTPTMIPHRLKARLSKDRPLTSLTLRSPADVGETLQTSAPPGGFWGYQALLKAYLSEGVRRDEAIPVVVLRRAWPRHSRNGASQPHSLQRQRRRILRSLYVAGDSHRIYDQARLHGVTRVLEVSSPQTKQHRTERAAPSQEWLWTKPIAC
jgi:hypothetical protein